MTVGDVIDRTAAEGELIRARSLFEAALEATADGILVVDRAGRIVWSNSKFQQMWGIPAGMLAEKTDAVALTSVLDQLVDPTAFLARVRQLYEQPLAESFDVLTFKDGRVYERYSTPQRLGEQVVGRVWSFRDVTERKRAEDEAHLLQALSTALGEADDLESMLHLVLGKVCQATGWALGQAWLPSADGTVLQCGPAWAHDSTAVAPFRAASLPERIPPNVGLLGRVWATRELHWIADVTKDPGFFRRAVAHAVGLRAAVAAPVFARGEVVAVIEFLVGGGREVDDRRMGVLSAVAAQLGSGIERKRAENALRESEARWRTLVEHAPEAIMVLDLARGTFVSANENAARLFGIPAERLLTLGPVDLSPPLQPGGRPSAEAAQDLLKTVVAEGAAVSEWACRSAAGRNFPCEVRLVRMPGLGGPQVRGSITDITERKKAEAMRAGQTRVLELIATGAPLEATLASLVRLIEAQTDDMLGSILLLDEEGRHLLHGAAPSLPEAYSRAIDGEAIGPAAGSCGTAAYRGEAVIVTDIELDPLWANYRDLALAHGLRACWSTPIRSYQGPVLGTFAMYYREPRSPRPEDTQVIELATHLAGIAIERRRAEEALRRDAAEIEDLYENAPCGYHSVDPAGRFTRINNTELAWLGYTRDEVVGSMRFQDVVTAKSWEDLQAQHPGVLGSGAVQNIELEMVRKDGTLLPVVLSAAVVRAADGTPVRGRAIVMDNTQRKRDEEALRESERTYRSLYTSTPVMMHSIDRHGRLLSVSDDWLTSLGYERDEVIGRKSTDFLTPASAQYAQNVVMPTYMRTGQCKDVPYQLVKKSGEIIDVLLSATAERDAKGQVVRSLAVLVDVTERKRAEEQLLRERRLFMGGPVVVFRWVACPGWPVEYVSPNVHVLFGRSAEDLMSGHASYAALVHPDDYDRVVREVGAYSDAGVPCFEQDYRIVRDDGEVRWLYDFTVVARDATGRITHYEGYVLDVTARKRAEAELQRYREHLEDLVAARTLKLESLNRELEAFCYSVSHDLRAPLRSIDGFSQILLEDYAAGLDTRGRQHLGRIRAASQRMGQLIDDLLNLSRVSRGELRMQRVDLSALAQKVIDLLRESAPERDVEFVIEEGVIADGDPRLLRVVLENLFGNAWKFTSKHPRARIEFGRTERQGRLVYFVRDDGAGFDMAYLDKLFGAFQRLHSPSEFEGTGIGLATVQRIIHRHGGRIWAEGAVEQGATFYFTLEPIPTPQ